MKSFKYITDIIDVMATTISISEETRDFLKNLGKTGDSYDDVIKKMYKITRKHLLDSYLHDRTDSITLDEFERSLSDD